MILQLVTEHTESTVLRPQEQKASTSITVLAHHIVPDYKLKSFYEYLQFASVFTSQYTFRTQ